MKALQKIIEGRTAAINNRKKALLQCWSPYTSLVGGFMKEKYGTELSEYDCINIAMCCENAVGETIAKGRSRLFETTDSGDISFLGVQLPVIAALVPTLVLNKIALVQALDRRVGAVFYMDILYGSTKGAVTAGDTMISAKTGHNRTQAGRLYASERVSQESLGAGGTTSYSVTLGYLPVKSGSVTATLGSVVLTDSATAGTLAGTGGSGTINYTTGAVVITLDTASDSSATPYIDYKYNYETKATNPVPEVNISVTNEAVTAEDFPLRANYTLAAALDIEKAHGIVLEDEIVKILGEEIKFEIDHLGIDMINTAAASADGANGITGIGAWDAKIASGQEWVFKKYEFVDYIEKGSNLIWDKTLRAIGNFIICGNDVARVIKQFKGTELFKEAAGLDTGKTVPTGPIEIGTFNGRLVIQDPFMTATSYTMGFRSDNYLFAGFLYAPYIPLFATPTITLADLKSQKGFLSSSGFKTINAGMYTFGSVSNLLVNSTIT